VTGAGLRFSVKTALFAAWKMQSLTEFECRISLAASDNGSIEPTAPHQPETTRMPDSHSTSCNIPSDGAAGTARSEQLIDRFRAVRQFSCQIVSLLFTEDCGEQSMPDVSPLRWHLAPTTWFFETFLLKHHPNYKTFAPRFSRLLISY
jgi:hypothetical protein